MSLKSNLHTAFRFATNNILVNNLLIMMRMEKLFSNSRHRYRNYFINKELSNQEIAGFSLRPEIQEYLEKSHKDLQKTALKFFPRGGKVLEIGCGPGLYLKDFDKDRYKLFAIDITEGMIELAKKENPSCTFYKGNFMDIDIPEKFDLIYSIGVLMYFPRTQLRAVFQKLHALLNPGGIIYINYPNAISLADTLYPDLTYIQYSPALVEKIASEHFTVLAHKQAFDGRKIGTYDKAPYKSENPHRKTTYKNSCLLIAQIK